MHSITAMLSGPCCANSRLVRPVVFQLPKPRLGPKPGSCPGFDSTEFVGYHGCNMPTHGYQPAPMDGPSI
jgi:hypothetical protein